MFNVQTQVCKFPSTAAQIYTALLHKKTKTKIIFLTAQRTFFFFFFLPCDWFIIIIILILYWFYLWGHLQAELWFENLVESVSALHYQSASFQPKRRKAALESCTPNCRRNSGKQIKGWLSRAELCNKSLSRVNQSLCDGGVLLCNLLLQSS